MLENLIVKDADGNITLSIDSKGNVNIRATDFTLEGKTIDSCILDKMLEDGKLTPSEKSATSNNIGRHSR
ncbi:MAG: hypothetical protein ACLT69_15865 [Intestinibacter bartlettii]